MSSQAELTPAYIPGYTVADVERFGLPSEVETIARVCGANSTGELHAALVAVIAWGMTDRKPTRRQIEIERRFDQMNEGSIRDLTDDGEVLFNLLRAIEKRALTEAIKRSGMEPELRELAAGFVPRRQIRRVGTRSRERGGCQSSRTRGSRRASSRSTGGGDSDPAGGGEPPPSASSQRSHSACPRKAPAGRIYSLASLVGAEVRS